jgi:fused signal recognition particle receptor
LKQRLKEELVEKQIPRGKTEEIMLNTIRGTFTEVLLGEEPDKVLEHIKENKKKGEPTKFLFLGVNGVGKTTSLAKMCYWLQKNNFSVVFAASDTFRAASVEQLEKHASNLGVNVVKHKYGGDPAAVAFDAIEHAKSKGIDVVLIDSAGRQHTSQNLMDELKKLKRVAKPDFTIFVADALTGNDAVEQAREFGNQIGFDLIILGKADVDQKGGAILSVSYVSGKPILFLGVGQDYKDLEPFDRNKTIEKLGV